MPSRRRRKSPQPETQDPIEQFAASLRASAEREQAERDRVQRERQQARDEARAAAERAAELRTARSELDRAIERARDARRTGKGVADADDTWRRAKARLIELETGAPPEWAHQGSASDS